MGHPYANGGCNRFFDNVLSSLLSICYLHVKNECVNTDRKHYNGKPKQSQYICPEKHTLEKTLFLLYYVFSFWEKEPKTNILRSTYVYNPYRIVILYSVSKEKIVLELFHTQNECEKSIVRAYTRIREEKELKYFIF